MPPLGRETLSSRLTIPLQVAPVLLWLADVYVFIWLLLHPAAGAHGLAGGALLPTLHRTVLVLLGVPFLLLPAVMLWAAGLRQVATDGVSLFVSKSYGGEAAVPLTEVLDVGEWRGVDLRTVKVTFAGKTAVGRKIRFLAPTRYVVPRGEPHPTVLALRDKVAAAEQVAGAERVTFGRKSAAA